MPETNIPLAAKLREAAEQTEISKASLCARCDKVCPKVSTIIARYCEEYGLIQDELDALRKEIPKIKSNPLGARKSTDCLKCTKS